MQKLFSKTKLFCKTSLRVGFYLAFRQIKRSNLWSTLLIIFVMTLTFLNLVVVSGILSGLVVGSSNAFKQQYSSDILITNNNDNSFIPNTLKITQILNNLEQIESYSTRIISPGQLEANYKTNGIFANKDIVAGELTGIIPEYENNVTNLKSLIVEGSYLNKDDYNQVLIGSNFLAEYSGNLPENDTLSNVQIGDTVRIIIGTKINELKVKGIVKSKVQNVGRRIFLTDKKLRDILETPNQNADEISIKINSKYTAAEIKKTLQEYDVFNDAIIKTYLEAQGQFFDDISRTFNILGLVIGTIGIIVSSITIFIVIFINAVTRKKYIGILKGIGICSLAIKTSYALQAFFYALIGNCIGLLLLFMIIKPYFAKNPIDFPFSDGILVAPFIETIIKVIILLFITILSGYIPAKIIVNKNTLDSILGRN